MEQSHFRRFLMTFSQSKWLFYPTNSWQKVHCVTVVILCIYSSTWYFDNGSMMSLKMWSTFLNFMGIQICNPTPEKQCFQDWLVWFSHELIKNCQEGRTECEGIHICRFRQSYINNGSLPLNIFHCISVPFVDLALRLCLQCLHSLLQNVWHGFGENHYSWGSEGVGGCWKEDLRCRHH